MSRIKVVILAMAFLMMSQAMVEAQRQRGANREEGPVYIDRAKAGPDFALQGEYVTDSSASHKYGVQVVALGNEKFQIVILTGGLPGDGWDGKGRTEVEGVREGENVKVDAKSAFHGSIANGVLSLTSPDGPITLKKIERESPRAGAKPPPGAVVLFDGTNTDAWQNGQMDERHLLKAGARTKKKYQDFTMHVEYLLPFKPLARDQERGNSGVYIQDRYEVQILDTFGHPAEFNGSGAMYRQHSPSMNMCYPPLQWQTYDIDFQAAKFDAQGKKIKNAVVTLNQNGVVVQDHYELTNKTGAGQKEGPAPGPIWLQLHNNPVFFRNVWIIEK